MPTLLDEAHLKELCELMGDDLVPLVQAFLRDGNERLQLLDRAWRAADWEQVRRQAHSLKGSSGNLGAASLSTACLQLEQLARDFALGAEPAVLATALHNVKQEMQAAGAELQRRFIPTSETSLR